MNRRRPKSRLARSIAVAAVMLAVGPARANDKEPKWSDDRPEARPIQRITFPGHPWVGKAVFSNDGSRLFVHLPNTAINLWEVGVYYWPEVLGGLLALTALASITALRRIARSSRIPGELHCRNCNYCLKDAPSTRCPECGHPIRRPIRGRPQWLRSLPWTCALALIAVAYGAPWAVQAPRSGRLSNYFNWWSQPLHHWAKEQNIKWLTKRGQPVDQIVEFEVATSSQKKRTLFTRPANPLWGRDSILSLTPDGHGIVFPLKERDSLAVINVESGRIDWTLDCPEIKPGLTPRWRWLAGFNEAGNSLFVTSIDESAKKTRLISWNWKSNQRTFVLDAPAEQIPYGRRSLWNLRSFIPYPNSENKVFLEAPDPSTPFFALSQEVVVRDIAKPFERRTLFMAALQPYYAMQFSLDGARILLALRDSHPRLVWVDSTTGMTCEGIELPAWSFFGNWFLLDQSNKRLFVHARFQPPFTSEMVPIWLRGIKSEEGLIVKDLSTGRWVGRFALPGEWRIQNIFFSPDGRYLASVDYETTSQRQGRFEMLIYDLTSLPHKVRFESDEEWEARQEARQRRAKERRAQTTTTRKSSPQRDVDK